MPRKSTRFRKPNRDNGRGYKLRWFIRPTTTRLQTLSRLRARKGETLEIFDNTGIKFQAFFDDARILRLARELRFTKLYGVIIFLSRYRDTKLWAG